MDPRGQRDLRGGPHLPHQARPEGRPHRQPPRPTAEDSLNHLPGSAITEGEEVNHSGKLQLAQRASRLATKVSTLQGGLQGQTNQAD